MITQLVVYYIISIEEHNMIQKIVTGQKDDYTTGCLLHYPYFEEHYKMIAIGLSKQQVLDPGPKV